MTLLQRLIAALLLSALTTSCTTTSRNRSSEKTPEIVEIIITPPAEEPAKPTPVPRVTTVHDYEFIDHKYFVVYYDRKYRLARWVKYELTKEQAGAHSAKRRNKFRADPLLQNRGDIAVLPKEYRKTGYDQGHLAPSADFAYSQEANDETFVMSNMVPQKPKLNRVAWRMLEEKVRRWACGEEKITVITGPLLDKKMDTLPSGLPIPTEFFKIIHDETPPKKSIAFIYNQTDSKNVLKNRIVTLSAIELRTGETFTPTDATAEPTRTPSQSTPWKECTP